MMTNEEAAKVLQERKITLGHDFGWDIQMLAAIDVAIQALKTASVQPITHGEWITTTMQALGGNVCSACHQTANGIFYKTKYCPNCGAKMER